MKTQFEIVEYLEENGKMSRNDIVEDLGVEWLDVEFSERAGYIKQVAPIQGGAQCAWFEVA
jgi:hypothetical protein